jgi:hypothetical protein
MKNKTDRSSTPPPSDEILTDGKQASSEILKIFKLLETYSAKEKDRSAQILQHLMAEDENPEILDDIATASKAVNKYKALIILTIAPAAIGANAFGFAIYSEFFTQVLGLQAGTLMIPIIAPILVCSIILWTLILYNQLSHQAGQIRTHRFLKKGKDFNRIRALLNELEHNPPKDHKEAYVSILKTLLEQSIDAQRQGSKKIMQCMLNLIMLTPIVYFLSGITVFGLTLTLPIFISIECGALALFTVIPGLLNAHYRTSSPTIIDPLGKSIKEAKTIEAARQHMKSNSYAEQVSNITGISITDVELNEIYEEAQKYQSSRFSLARAVGATMASINGVLNILLGITIGAGGIFAVFNLVSLSLPTSIIVPIIVAVGISSGLMAHRFEGNSIRYTWIQFGRWIISDQKSKVFTTLKPIHYTLIIAIPSAIAFALFAAALITSIPFPFIAVPHSQALFAIIFTATLLTAVSLFGMPIQMRLSKLYQAQECEGKGEIHKFGHSLLMLIGGSFYHFFNAGIKRKDLNICQKSTYFALALCSFIASIAFGITISTTLHLTCGLPMIVSALLGFTCRISISSLFHTGAIGPLFNTKNDHQKTQEDTDSEPVTNDAVAARTLSPQETAARTLSPQETAVAVTPPDANPNTESLAATPSDRIDSSLRPISHN